MSKFADKQVEDTSNISSYNLTRRFGSMNNVVSAQILAEKRTSTVLDVSTSKRELRGKVNHVDSMRLRESDDANKTSTSDTNDIVMKYDVGNLDTGLLDVAGLQAATPHGIPSPVAMVRNMYGPELPSLSSCTTVSEQADSEDVPSARVFTQHAEVQE